MKRIRSTRFFLCALVGALIFAAILSMSSGQYDISMETVIASFAHAAGLPILQHVIVTPEQEAVLFHIRLPRTLVGLMVGAGLGISGAVLQGIFSNPLADPGIIGVSSGASVGAVLAIALGVTAVSVLSLPAFAFCGSMLAVGLLTPVLAGAMMAMSSVSVLANALRLKRMKF